MKNLTATLCAAMVMAGAAWGGPVAVRTLVLDVTQPDNVWSTTVTRGEAFYIQANLYNRGAVYTNNDLTGYIWYASNATAAAGAIMPSTTNSAGYVWFWMSASNSLGLATNDTFPTSYFAQVVLTNATTRYDWRQGKFTVRNGGGLSGVSAATAFTTLNWDAINGIGTMPGSLSTANVQSIVNTMASTGTYHNADELGGIAAAAYNTNNASTLSSGTVPLARLSGVTTNNASQLDSGTLAEARIDSAIARDSEVDAHTQNVTTAHNVDARIAASTQTIAGASVSGTVPSATTAATATNALQLGNVAASAFVTNNQTSVTNENITASYIYRTGVPIQSAIDLIGSRLYGSDTYCYFDWDDMIGYDSNGQLWIDGKSRHLIASNGNIVVDWYSGGVNVYGGGNVVTNGQKIAAATNADYAVSAGTAATATGLVDNAVITVAPPTASNSPVDYATFSGALVGNFVSFFTTNRVNASTNAMLPTVPASSSVTSVTVTAVGQYYLTWHATNRTFRQLQGGAAEVELWACENTPGSLTHKPEIYIYNTATTELIEFGENVASQTVAAGSTLTKQTFSIPYGAFATNVDCQFVVRLKVTTLSGTPTVQIGCGGTTPSHFSIDVPNSSLVPDNANNAYNLGNIPAASYVTNGGATLNGQAISNGAAITVTGGGADLASTNYFRNAENLTNLTAAGIVTNGGATVNGNAISNGAVITAGQKVILRPTTNHAAAALTSTYLSSANITTLKSASWASAGSAVSNTIVELAAGQYLVYYTGSLLTGGTTTDGRVFMQSVIGGVSNTIAYSRIIPATIVIQTPSYHGAGAYVSSSVPVGLTFNMYANVAITNDASITTFSIERQ